MGWLPSDQASLGRRLPFHGAGVSSRAGGALPVSVGWTWSFAVPWPCAPEAEHISLGSALEAAGWRQLALSDVPIKSCSRYMNVTPGCCDWGFGSLPRKSQSCWNFYTMTFKGSVKEILSEFWESAQACVCVGYCGGVSWDATWKAIACKWGNSSPLPNCWVEPNSSESWTMNLPF